MLPDVIGPRPLRYFLRRRRNFYIIPTTYYKGDAPADSFQHFNDPRGRRWCYGIIKDYGFTLTHSWKLSLTTNGAVKTTKDSH